MRSVIVSVDLEIPMPNAKTDYEAIIEALHYELPKEYVADSFRIVKVIKKESD